MKNYKELESCPQEETREPQVQRQLARLRNSRDELVEIFLEMKERLRPVLAKETMIESMNKEQPQKQCSPLGDEMASAIDDLIKLRLETRELIDRLEI